MERKDLPIQITMKTYRAQRVIQIRGLRMLAKALTHTLLSLTLPRSEKRVVRLMINDANAAADAMEAVYKSR